MEKKFHITLKNFLFEYRFLANTDEYNEFKKEVDGFIKTINNLPMSQQYAVFMEKYGAMAQTLRQRDKIQLLTSINKSLNFFKVLAILGIIVVIIAAFLNFASLIK